MSSTPISAYPLPAGWDRKAALAAPLLAAACVVSALYLPAVLGVAVAVLIGALFVDRPYPLLLLMVFLIPFNFVFTIGPIPVAAELLKVFIWVPVLLVPEARHIRRSRYEISFAVLAGLVVMSLVRSHDFLFTFKEAVRLLSSIGLCYVVPSLVDSREKVVQIFQVLVASTLVVAIYGFYQFMIHDYGALFWIVNPRLSTGLSHYRDEFWLWRNRMISVLTSEMELGHYFNLVLPVAVVLWLRQKQPKMLSGRFLAVVIILSGLVLTFTFGAWLALAVTTGLFILLLDRRRRWKLLFAGVFCAALTAWMVVYGPLRTFVEGKLFGSGIGSLSWDIVTRLGSWVFALQTWWGHPWVGVGIGNFEYINSTHDIILGSQSLGTSPHETYLYLLAEIGVIGLTAMLFIVLGSIRGMLRLGKDPYLGLPAMASSLCADHKHHRLVCRRFHLVRSTYQLSGVDDDRHE